METGININNSEWEVMEYLWEDSPRTVMQIVREMKDRLHWSKSTSTTIVRRMEAKGYIRYEEGERAREYYPVLSRDEVVEVEARHLLDKAFNGSIGLMVNSLVPRNRLTEEDICELKRILNKAGGE